MPEWVHMHLMHAGVYGGQERPSNHLETGVRWLWANWCVCWELNLGPLQEQEVLWTVCHLSSPWAIVLHRYVHWCPIDSQHFYYVALQVLHTTDTHLTCPSLWVPSPLSDLFSEDHHYFQSRLCVFLASVIAHADLSNLSSLPSHLPPTNMPRTFYALNSALLKQPLTEYLEFKGILQD